MVSPDDIAMQIAARVKARRLELNLTQGGMAARAGLKFATYRRFEQTGEISLKGLLQIGFALDSLHEFDVLSGWSLLGNSIPEGGGGGNPQNLPELEREHWY